MEAGTTESIYRDAKVTSIETQQGMWDALTPSFNIRTIAHALGNNCRYNGHCVHFYSVAEHSVMVSRMMEHYGLGDPLEGLLHDATEAYLSDIPAPFKQFFPELQKFDEDLEAKLRAHFKLDPKKSKGCKTADWYALFLEAWYLMPSRGSAFLDPQHHRGFILADRRKWRINCFDGIEAATLFMDRYYQLTRSL